GTARRSYVLAGRGQLRACLLGHVPFAPIGEQPLCLVERQPAHLVDLVAVLRREVAQPAALVADEEERDDLEDPLAVPVEPVADVAELPERAAVRAGLLGHLAEGRLLAALTVVDPALRERPGSWLLPR